MPAIELIKSTLEVVELDGEQRLPAARAGAGGRLPLAALSERAEAALAAAFDGVAGEAGEAGVELEIEGRVLSRAAASARAWPGSISRELCDGPRGRPTTSSSRGGTIRCWSRGVPRFARRRCAESVRRFTWLVDEFYDRRVKLIFGGGLRLLAGAVRRRQVERTQPADSNRHRAAGLIEMQTRTQLL